MKATGMIRRMDELGRVVIPKEMRRTMHLKEGEELEIFADEEGLLLKKYSALSALSHVAETYAQVVAALADDAVYVADAECVLTSVGDKATGLFLSHPVLEAMGRRRPAVLDDIEVAEGKYYPHVMICPVVAHGDLFGALVLGSRTTIDSRRQGVMQAACCLLSKELGD